jgi:hypothetical protein
MEGAEACILHPILHKALLLWFMLAIHLLGKKRSVFYKKIQPKQGYLTGLFSNLIEQV